MSAEFPTALPDPNELRVALIVPWERSFYSPGVGNPQTFRGKPHFVSEKDKLVRKPGNKEELSEAILKNPAYDLGSTSAERGLSTIQGVHSYVRRPSGSLDGFVRTPFTVYKYNIDEVTETAEYVPEFVDPIDLLILTEAFAQQVRRRTVIDLSA